MLMKYISRFNFFFLLPLFLLSSCSGWRIADSMQNEKIPLRVPYVQGDETGELTAQLIATLHAQPGFRIDESAQYEVLVKIMHSKDEKMGYRYDPIELKKEKKELILNESRAKTLVSLEIVDCWKHQTITGPIHILGSIVYDHQQNTLNNDIQEFSAGQLSDIDTISDSKKTAVYRDLAQKISLWLQNHYDMQVIEN